MTKKFLTVALIAGSVYLVSCSAEPSDLRPGKKVSVDAIPPGTRSTGIVDKTENSSEHGQETEVMLNHDEHDNKLKDTKEHVSPTNETVHADSVENHN